MPPQFWKVGELAKETGLTVRTLHHYDEIGLLTPSYHTGSGHRLYAAADVARLQRIVSLRYLGFSLEEIRGCLDRADFSTRRVVEMHLERLREQVALQQRLVQRLEAVAALLRTAEAVSVEELLRTIEGMNMIEKYYTPEQLAELKERADRLGEAGMRKAEGDWQEVMAAVRAAMERGDDPASPAVQALAARWMGLVNAFTGGNPEIARSVQKMFEQEPNIHGMDTGPVREMRAYIDKALAAAKGA